MDSFRIPRAGKGGGKGGGKGRGKGRGKGGGKGRGGEKASAALQALLDASRSGSVSAVEASLDGQDELLIVGSDHLQRTALHLAAWTGHADVVEVLLSRGASVAQEAVDGIQPLHFAAQNGHTAVCKALLKAGAKINAKGTKRIETPLHLAASKGHVACVEYLLKKNADGRMANLAGRTAHEVASDAAVRDLLCANGATAQSNGPTRDATTGKGAASTGAATAADMAGAARYQEASGEGGDEQVRMRGTVRRWHADRGFGFIAPEGGGDDVFCHHSSIVDGDALAEHASVEFVHVVAGHGKARATEVTGGIDGDSQGNVAQPHVCREWQRGACSRGDRCKFLHEVSTADSAGSIGGLELQDMVEAGESSAPGGAIINKRAQSAKGDDDEDNLAKRARHGGE